MNAHSDMRRAAGFGGNPGFTSATALLAGLQSAFREIDDCLAELEEVTAGCALDMMALATARLRMSQARHAKRRLVQKACEFLLSDASGAAVQSIRGIQDENSHYFRVSIEHVLYWTPHMLRTDWPGFCKASRKMRAKMKHLTTVEQRLLLPMLATRAWNDADQNSMDARP